MRAAAPERSNEIGQSTGLTYMYGVVPAGQPVPKVHGVGGSDVAVLQTGKLGALVSDLPDSFGVLGLEGAALEAALVAHEGVLEAALEAGGVVPCRFGTVLVDERAVVGLLEAEADSYSALVDRVLGAAQWVVRMTWRAESAQQVVMGGPPTGGASGRDYLLSRLQEREGRRRLAQLAGACAASIHDRLLASCAEGKLVASTVTVAEGRQRLLDACYLVRSADRAEFEDVMRTEVERGAEFDLLAEVSGPWPPYEFVDFCPHTVITEGVGDGGR